MPLFERRHIPWLLAILLLAALAYANTLDVPFSFDDRSVIVDNPIIRDVGYFVHPSEAREFGGYFEYKFFVRRYVGYFTFALNYLVNGIDVRGYHIVNIAIHLINVLLVYALARALALIAGGAGHVPLMAAALFGLHPVQTQAVTYIWQRVTSLSVTFYLFGALLYVMFRLSDDGKGMRRWLLYAGVLICAALGMKTKEIVFTLPVMLLALEAVFFGLRGGVARRFAVLVPVIATMALVPLGLIDLSVDLDQMRLGAAATEVPSVGRLEFLASQMPVLVTYLRLFLLPMNLNLDYDYPAAPSPHVLFASTAVVLALMAAGLWCLMRGRRLAGFGIIWFFVALSVESSIIPMANMIMEHRMYLASFGLAFAAGDLISISGGRRAAAMVACAVLLFSAATFDRNAVWVTKESLWADTANKSPGKARPHYNLGLARLESGRFDEALPPLERAVELEPGKAITHNNLAVAYLQLGRPQEALTHLERSVELDPENPKSLYNLGLYHFEAGNAERARALMLRTLELDPSHQGARGFLNYLGD